MNNFDVVIIGGGTAGLMLARELGNFKRKTLVLDRKDNLLEFSFNTLGSFINVDDFDLSKDVIAQKISDLVFQSKRVKREIPTKAHIWRAYWRPCNERSECWQRCRQHETKSRQTR